MRHLNVCTPCCCHEVFPGRIHRPDGTHRLLALRRRAEVSAVMLATTARLPPDWTIATIVARPVAKRRRRHIQLESATIVDINMNGRGARSRIPALSRSVLMVVPQTMLRGGKRRGGGGTPSRPVGSWVSMYVPESSVGADVLLPSLVVKHACLGVEPPHVSRHV